MSGSEYYSFVEQVIHYFDRPHQQPPVAQVPGKSGWLGRDLPHLDKLAYYLSPGEVEEIHTAVARARALERPLQTLSAADFALPTLEQRIAEWRTELADGLGFQVVRGVPVDSWSQQESELFFWCLGLHLGRPGEQNPQGHLLGHVTDTGANKADPMVRLYKTAARIKYHCDAADVVGLLCLSKAKTGGHSRIVSSVAVFNELVQHRPDLAARLFEPVQLDVRGDGEDGGSSLPVQPCCFAEGRLRTFYHADYFRSVVRHPEVAPLSELEQALLDTYETIAMDPGKYLDMDLQPGDIQLLSNHSILHARTAYEDYDDTSRRRRLLRLWLSL